MRGRALYWGDILLYFEPMLRFARQELLEGRLPLWNSHILCGQPYIGNPQMNLFFPSTLLLLIFPVWLALSLGAMIHLYLCGLGMYLFLRRWTVRRLPAAAGAAVYMGSAYLLGRLQFPPMIQTAAFYPLLLAALDRNVDRPSSASRFMLAAVTALTTLAAHSQVTYLAFLSGLAYTAMRLWRRTTVSGAKRSPADVRRRVWLRTTTSNKLREALVQAAPIAAAAAAGLAISAIYLLPAIQLLRESPREQMSVGQANRFFLDLPHILSGIFPRFAGHPATRDFWARGNAWEPAWFVGWAPLVLALYAAATCRKENLVRFWLALGIVGAWLSLGSVGGLFWVAFYAVPGISRFHDPARFLLWPLVSVAVLTAVALDALELRRPARFRPIAPALLLAIVLPLAWYSSDWIPTAAARVLERRPEAVALNARSAVGSDRIALPANTLYWKRVVTDGYADYGDAKPSTVLRTTRTLLSNLDMRAGLDSASGYEPVPVAAHVDLEGLAKLAIQRREPNLDRMMSLLDVRALAVPSVGVYDVPGFEDAPSASSQSGPIRLLTNTRRVGRAWLVRHVVRVEGSTRCAAAITAPGFNQELTAIISGADQAPLPAQHQNAGSHGVVEQPVSWHQETPSHISMRTDAGASSAFLVYAGTAYPGWTATIDEKPTPVVCADGALLGFYVPAGKHEIVLSYRPNMFRLGAYISLVAVAIGTALLTRAFILKRRLSGSRMESP